MRMVDNRGLKHDSDDPYCRYADGPRISFMTRMLMGICCNTCRSLPPVLKQKLTIQIDSIVTIDGRQYRLVDYSKHSGGVMDPDGQSEVTVRFEAVR